MILLKLHKWRGGAAVGADPQTMDLLLADEDSDGNEDYDDHDEHRGVNLVFKFRYNHSLITFVFPSARRPRENKNEPSIFFRSNKSFTTTVFPFQRRRPRENEPSNSEVSPGQEIPGLGLQSFQTSQQERGDYRRSEPSPPSRVLCLQNLPPDALKYEFEDMLKPYGEVEVSVKVMNKNMALVQMASLEGLQFSPLA